MVAGIVSVWCMRQKKQRENQTTNNNSNKQTNKKNEREKFEKMEIGVRGRDVKWHRAKTKRAETNRLKPSSSL